MTRCYRFEKLLTAYADGELSERLTRAVGRHLAGCERCARELDSIRASDRILRGAGVPAVAPERWGPFQRGLDAALDAVDREARRSTRLRELRPVDFGARRRGFAIAATCAAAVLAIVALGPGGLSPLLPWAAGNECIVESIETYAEGYTPMFFTSEDPDMTVIWVFSEDAGAGTSRP
jgi:anti-sigma factor RsiW